jgi:hypothetical protein
MRSMILNDEEELVLREEVECRLRELALEITHTDRGDFKAMLKHRQAVLQQVAQQMATPFPPDIMSITPPANRTPEQPGL